MKMNVIDDYDYTFKLLKTKIKAYEGSAGLFKNMKYWIDKDFATAWANTIIDHIMKYGKEL